ncbi:ANTAR domain-containing protein [Rhodococcus erythropolis]|uniref:ANTAR domain-containing protein n=1 Tax=Rhodococcus erythropolis TaxID=1833 RepID=UPI0029494B79|nr:ANTAR domain-containing protein [Rhodococcus erythropolis]MDV6278358.1 ANTAR domain-containing protein [Rhodococcus erythropolis]
MTGSSGFYIDVAETLDRTVKESVDELVDEISSSRGAIEQAKGMLIAYGISAERAFNILIWCSQQRNVKLRHISEQLITRARATSSFRTGCVRNSTIYFSARRSRSAVTSDACRLLLDRRHLAEGPPSRRRHETTCPAHTVEETPHPYHPNRGDRAMIAVESPRLPPERMAP